MKNIIYLSLITLISILSGCSIYKKYERPESTVAVVDSLYRHSVKSDDTTGIASLEWRELFSDPQLQKLIEKGIENNTDLNIARLRVDEAKALLSTARLSYLPSISLTPQGTVGKIESRSATKSYELAASANWEIDIFGKLTNAKWEARASQFRMWRILSCIYRCRIITGTGCGWRPPIPALRRKRSRSPFQSSDFVERGACKRGLPFFCCAIR